MGLLNNLRQHVVRKLIRPEDGYTFTGFSENQPLKFYFQEDTNKYLLGMRSDNWYYFEPTLSGWAAYSSKYVPWGRTVKETKWNPVTQKMDTFTYGHEPSEVEFSRWIHGVLDNIYEQYSERLNNMSMQDIKKLTKREDGEIFMLNKESFCDIMEALDKYWGDLNKLESVLDVVFENNVLTEIFDSVIDALEEDLEPNLGDYEEPMLYQWLFDYDAGRHEKAKEGIDGHPLTTAAELYDYLVWKRDVKAHATEVGSDEECDCE